MFDLVQIAIGAAGVGAVYFLYLVATKGLPAALARVKAKWNAGKTVTLGLQAGIESAHERISDLERDLANVKAALAAAKPASAAPSAAPSTVPAAAVPGAAV